MTPNSGGQAPCWGAWGSLGVCAGRAIDFELGFFGSRCCEDVLELLLLLLREKET